MESHEIDRFLLKERLKEKNANNVSKAIQRLSNVWDSTYFKSMYASDKDYQEGKATN